VSGKTPGAESKTPEHKKDNWNTPQHAVVDASTLIGMPFTLDACACDAETAKAVGFITPEQDALTVAWVPDTPGAVWCNPPFSRKTEFLQHAWRQSKWHHLTIVMMIPYEPCTKWWREYVSNRASIVYVPDGRYNYCEPISKKEITGVNFASCFVVFTPLTMPTIYVDFNRGKGLLPENN
jgi:phage N-6-adenine-methyltransferase